MKQDLYRIETGFTGISLILLSLFDNGMEEYSYRILYNEEFPGWLYYKFRSYNNLGKMEFFPRRRNNKGTSMNSFNHYSYWSVCEAIYSRIEGLRNLLIRWKKILIKPQLNYSEKNWFFIWIN